MHDMHTRALSKPQGFYCGLGLHGLYALHDTKLSVLEAKQYMYTSYVFIPKRTQRQAYFYFCSECVNYAQWLSDDKNKLKILFFSCFSSVFRQPAKT
jgi:hypothetical protein